MARREPGTLPWTLPLKSPLQMPEWTSVSAWGPRGRGRKATGLWLTGGPGPAQRGDPSWLPRGWGADLRAVCCPGSKPDAVSPHPESGDPGAFSPPMDSAARQNAGPPDTRDSQINQTGYGAHHSKVIHRFLEIKRNCFLLSPAFSDAGGGRAQGPKGCACTRGDSVYRKGCTHCLPARRPAPPRGSGGDAGCREAARLHLFSSECANSASHVVLITAVSMPFACRLREGTRPGDCCESFPSLTAAPQADASQGVSQREKHQSQELWDIRLVRTTRTVPTLG